MRERGGEMGEREMFFFFFFFFFYFDIFLSRFAVVFATQLLP